MMDRISFLDILDVCHDISKGKMTEKEFIKYFNDNIEVQPYLPIGTKEAFIDLMIIMCNSEGSSNGQFAKSFEILSVLQLLLLYTNIEIFSEDMTENNYDLFLKSGFYVQILKQCKDDYDRFCNMAQNALYFELLKMSSAFNNFNKEVLDDNINSLNNILKGLKNEDLQLIKEIIEFNDPATKQIKDIVYDKNLIENIVASNHDLKEKLEE